MNLRLLLQFKSAIVCIAILLVLQTQVWAQYTITQQDAKAEQLGEVSQFIADTSYSFAQIDTSTRFIPILTKTINPLYQKNDCWVKLKLRAKGNIDNNIISINFPLLDSVKIYFKINNNNWDSAAITKTTPFKQRIISNQYFAFKIPPLSANDTLTVFLKINAELSISVPLEFYSQKKHESQANTNNIIVAIYLGIMLSLFLYNVFVYTSVKDSVYLYYIIYILFILLAQLGLSGFFIRYAFTTPEYNTTVIVLCSIISGICGVKFESSFLMLKTYAPRINKSLTFFYLGYVFIFLAYFTGFHEIAFKCLDMIGISIALYSLTFAIYVATLNYRPAKFFLVAWSFFLVSLILFILKSYGVIPITPFTNSILQIGSAVEAILLSFALADKINIYRKEKDLMQAKALTAARENERIIREQNVTLEINVAERTKELNITNSELSKTLTDLKETQTQLVESEKMASLGQLTAGIAHEINNPINFVTSNVKPLKRDVDILLEILTKVENIATGDSAEKEKQILSLKAEYDFDYLQEEIAFLLKGINEGSSRTAEIVKGLRVFSRVDEDDLKKADINDGIDSTIIMINNLLNGRIVIEKHYGDLPLAECYPGKLNQVFLNLMSNAIYAINAKFQNEVGGIVKISTSFDDKSVQISVEDNGIGMTAETQKKLFEPFFTTKPVGEGTGLGLSISYNTIKKHNGTISIKSELNVGTCFTIEIPIIQTNI
jgi:signal transduction histidine kinase